MSLTVIREVIRQAKFSPQTHRIISWFTTTNASALCRALSDLDVLVDQRLLSDLEVLDRDKTVMQLYSIAWAVKKCTNLTRCSCSFVYHPFISRQNLVFQDPDQDALANSQIYKFLIEATTVTGTEWSRISTHRT